MPIPVLYANQFTLAESENEKIIHIKIAKKELCIVGSCVLDCCTSSKCMSHDRARNVNT